MCGKRCNGIKDTSCDNKYFMSTVDILQPVILTSTDVVVPQELLQQCVQVRDQGKKEETTHKQQKKGETTQGTRLSVRIVM